LTGDNNIAIGNGTLLNSTEGNSNIAIGVDALNSNLKGDNNIAMGNFSLLSNTTGGGNIAIGNEALKLNTTGPLNTAIGAKALLSNKTGQLNTANDVNALLSNTIGDENTANGSFALEKNTEGFYNTSSGSYALAGNTTGYNNTAIGTSALSSNTTGYGNTAVGYASGPSIGSVNLSNSTAIGNAAKVTSSNQVQIGNLLVESIGGYQDWSDLSDGRYKNNIIEDVAGIDFIMGLRPITYNLDVEKLSTKLGEYSRVDKNGNRMQAELSPEMVEARQRKASKREVGFIAQEVEELANNLGFDFSGVEVPENEQSMYRLRYAEFVVPIVKAMQEQQVVITGLESVVARLQIQIEGLKKSK
ncbi:MAG: tail fiber domain-containing protein, partial [Ignavibacteriae bacterium]|nr:tail fiber domain-containing protein [Ignavibacteriota bacterium]